ncbi:hypothetical protein [Streptomyces indicus]|uniref:Uncharacterized protein n=1 Tax=Streptomyces indicus TaxID=417292 RepID=A0A1G8V3K0_9ACTN|nr:hypothetical protein [Streptomyces indicus]SDJ60706.1 hypothetical protein SAMN05421806_1011238 [Streptomyces indicus]
MGLDMEVLIVDWERLRSLPVEERSGMVEDAVFGAEDLEVYLARPEGWSGPGDGDAEWWARYEFRDTMTSYKAHFWAGNRWDELRGFVDASLREVLDQFAAPLFWGEHNYELLPQGQPPFTPAVVSRPDMWSPEIEAMLWLPPEDVKVLDRYWSEVAPRLDTLREPFERHIVEPIGWIQDFASFARLVSEWGDVISRAAGRGWAVIGLKC